MTKEEILKHMNSKLAAEIEDAENYLKMYKHLLEEDKYDLLSGLMEIIKDEYSHAYFIKMKIEEMDGVVPSEYIKKMEEIEERIESFPY